MAQRAWFLARMAKTAILAQNGCFDHFLAILAKISHKWASFRPVFAKKSLKMTKNHHFLTVFLPFHLAQRGVFSQKC